MVADLVFLLVQDTLLSLSDVAAVLAGHVTLFLADLVVFVVQGIRLPFGDLAFLQLFIDAPVLVVQTRIDFSAARMVLRPLAGRGVDAISAVRTAARAVTDSLAVSLCMLLAPHYNVRLPGVGNLPTILYALKI